MRIFLIITFVVVYGHAELSSSYQYTPSNSRQTPINSYDAPLGSVVGPSISSSPNKTTSSLSSSSSSDSSSSNVVSETYSSRYTDASSNDDHIDNDSNRNVIQKNIYVHLPPPKVEYNQQKSPIAHVPPPQVHYKIIFIRAPTATPATPLIPPLPQNEERTIVYVLSRKLEEEQEIVIPTPEPTEPSKPEVYFIRYKSKTEDSQSSVEEGISDTSSSTSSSGSDGNGKIAGGGVSAKYGGFRSNGPY